MKHGMRMGQRNAGGGKEGLQPLLDPTTRPASFTSHVPAPILFHTTGPARFAAHVLQSGFAHTTCPGSRFRFTPLVLRASHHMPCKVSIERQSQFWISCHIVRCPAPRCITRPSANTLLPYLDNTLFMKACRNCGESQ